MVTELIHNTFDTARMVAFYRALETERPTARFHDPYARLLAGERGEEIVQKLPRATMEMWAIVLRTCIYDEILLRLIEQEQVDTVLNLAAGLDTRPYRLALPASLRWIEVDRAEVLSYKEEKLAGIDPRCRLERQALDITDAQARTTLLNRVSEESKNIAILAEGLLVYLTIDQVSSLAADLRRYDTLRWWLTEYLSPLALQRDEGYWNTFTAEGAQTRFAPPGGSSFFQLHGWQIAEFRSPLAEALRLKLPVRFGWLLRPLVQLTAKYAQDANANAGGFILLK
jgi:methyltransferase (TIGR00027 family)